MCSTTPLRLRAFFTKFLGIRRVNRTISKLGSAKDTKDADTAPLKWILCCFNGHGWPLEFRAKSDTEKEPSQPLRTGRADDLKSNPTLQASRFVKRNGKRFFRKGGQG
jgi:hypothetical protein